jgi:16S rRNA (uracil1498-N3)-methyltransferase
MGGLYHNNHPMHARFFAPALAVDAPTVQLPLEEARHLLRVLRLRVGDEVRVFDGRGLERRGRVADIERDAVLVALEESVVAAPESRTRIALAQALLKGDAMDDVVRDAVMLGVAVIAPLLTAHVEGDRRGQAAGLRIPRWTRIAVASAKQCGRAVVPEVLPPQSLAACLAAPQAGVLVPLVEPTASLGVARLADLSAAEAPSAATLLVGPEGGWSDEELRLMAGYGARGITLGGRTLRAESAALVGLSALHTVWGEWDRG